MWHFKLKVKVKVKMHRNEHILKNVSLKGGFIPHNQRNRGKQKVTLNFKVTFQGHTETHLKHEKTQTIGHMESILTRAIRALCLIKIE